MPGSTVRRTSPEWIRAPWRGFGPAGIRARRFRIPSNVLKLAGNQRLFIGSTFSIQGSADPGVR